mgnify:CR=1 FL=1
MLEDGIEFNLPKNRSSVIKVVGVGGGGSNAVNHMSNVGVNGVDFIVCNTDAQALYHSPVANKVQLGVSLTEGLGAGADPEIGRDAARESLAEITRILETGTKMCFVTAGMGGGTGTGAAPVIAKAAKEMGILTIGIITSPFSFEGNIRAKQAENGIREMREATDSLIVINNDKLRQVYGDLGFRNAFAKADEVLAGAAKGIAEVITNHYTQNIDLRDAKTVLENSGSALFGTGEGEGPNRAADAIAAALDSPLLNDNHIKGAKNVLLLLTSGSGSDEVTIDEIGEITDHIQREAGGNANVIMGIGAEEEIGSRITCTIVATGFPTGTRVLPTDKLEVVVHDLKETEEVEETAAPVAEIAEAAPEVEAPEVKAPVENERIVMDLGMEEEDSLFADPTPVAEEVPTEEAAIAEVPTNEAPMAEVEIPVESETTFEVEPTFEEEAPAMPVAEIQHIEEEPAFEVEQSFEAEAEASEFEAEAKAETVAMATEEINPNAGFPQMPEEDESVFDQSMSDEPTDEEATVHVLEWDLSEDEGIEAETEVEAEMEAEASDSEMIAEHHEVEQGVFDKAATDDVVAEENHTPLEAPTWDLFGALEDDAEEIELTIVDEEESEVVEDASPVMREDDAFDQPAPPQMEKPQGMIQNAGHTEHIPQALETPITEPKQDEFEAAVNLEVENEDAGHTTFTLDDIDGDGFALDMEETTGMVSGPSQDAPAEETSYDPFEMSLTEVPNLQSKAEQETIEHSFKVPSVEFEKEELVAPTEVMDSEAQDPDLHFEIKQAPVEKAPAVAPAPQKSLPKTDEMDVPLSELPKRTLNDMPSKVQDRISRLQSFQYKFKANQQNLNDAERIPAYMRQGMDVDLPSKSDEQPSNIGVDSEGNLRTNNSFLHDNVD